jgi:alkanesulfonate monooxygenase SsuD/methylene tetrahydromethanopterin reductase-like flavin-dependent oxidoreductase (luciferase family)
MSALHHEPERLKIVHTYGVGLHSQEDDYDVNDNRWQKRQIDEFVEFAVEAEDLGYDGLTVTEHHAPSMPCPAPHVLLAAAAVKTSRIRLGTAVSLLPLYEPVRVAEEAGTLDLLSGGRFELGIGRGVPGEALIARGRDIDADTSRRAFAEAVEVLHRALTERDITYAGEFMHVSRPTTIATRPLQDPLPIWVGTSSLDTVRLAASYGWSIMRNFGSVEEHRAAFDAYREAATEHGHTPTAGNLMIERFVAIGHDERDIERKVDRLTAAFGRFLSVYFADGRRPVPTDDGEFQTASPTIHRPAILVAGTPGTITDALESTLADTGAGRLLVETFSQDQARLLAEEVVPDLRARHESRLAALT